MLHFRRPDKTPEYVQRQFSIAGIGVIAFLGLLVWAEVNTQVRHGFSIGSAAIVGSVCAVVTVFYFVQRRRALRDAQHKASTPGPGVSTRPIGSSTST